ncbi:C1q-related factor-like [Saccostrea echinata]|uniref:C1q-related factor-like n=1 Tax=Saccostrea echinata TaxID=191078 RepID=UPI002A837E48|nr:C1q-related factor-like [Saccostrea echinata]
MYTTRFPLLCWCLAVIGRVCICENTGTCFQYLTNYDTCNRETIRKPDVSFMATLGNDVRNPRSNMVIKFDHVISNKGGGYSGASVVFTTPISGTYFFIVTLSIPAQSNASDYLRVHIMKNGVEASYLFIGAHSVWVKRSENTLLELQRGDRVYVSVGSTSSSEFAVIPGGQFHCHFTGFLID